MAKLQTTPRRVLLAIAAGLIVPAAAQYPVLRFLESKWATTNPGLVLLMTLIGAALMMLVPGLPVWLYLHRRGGGVWLAASIGAGSTMAVILALVLMTSGLVTVSESPVMIFGTALVIAITGAVAFATCALMWRIAYPPALQNPPDPQVF